VEGVGSYGAILTDELLADGRRVVESPTISRAESRGVGKTDTLDAVRIARSVLGRDTDRLRVPRAEGDRVAVRVLVVAREQMTTERTRAINALTALVRAVDLGIDARKPLTTRQVRGIAAWRIRGESLAVATARAESVRLSRRILQISDELRENRVVLTALFRQLAPDIPSSVAWVPWLRRVSWWRGPTPAGFVPRRPWRRWRAPVPFQPRPETPPGIALTAGATVV